MRLNVFQKIIDFLRQKKNVKNYHNMFFLANYLYNSGLIDCSLVERIKSHKENFYLRLLFSLDKKAFQKAIDKIDPTTIPPMTGELRQFQIRLAEFTKTLIADLEQAGFHPYLSDGSLLGAIRHKGFIPWDDDVDFELLRDEFEQLKEFVKQNYLYCDSSNVQNYDEQKKEIDSFLKKYPNKIFFSQKPACLCAYIGTSCEDVLVIDFFPRDYINPNLPQEKYDEYYKKTLNKFQNIRYLNEKLLFSQKELNNEEIYVKDSPITAMGWEHCDFWEFGYTFYLNKDDILPYKRVEFEGTSYYSLNNTDKYLTFLYGNYMRIPADCKIAEHIKGYNKWLQRNKQ